MDSYIVRWNTGYGDEYTEVYACDETHAEELVYELWFNDIESQEDTEVMGLATDESREEYL